MPQLKEMPPKLFARVLSDGEIAVLAAIYADVGFTRRE
jgi:hypothetical protein